MGQTYYYKARDKFGRMEVGSLTANDINEVVKNLKKHDLFAVSISKNNLKTRYGFREWVLDNLVWKKPNARELMIFSRQLSYMIRSGLNLINSLSTLSDQMTNSKLKNALTLAVKSLEEGSSLRGALEKNKNVFPPIYLSMIGAGEEAGALEEVLDRIVVHYELEYEMEQKVKGALIYPGILIISTFIVLYILTSYVLPEFSLVFSGLDIELPFLTLFVFRFSEIIQNTTLILLPIVLLLFISLKLNLKLSEDSKLSEWVDLLKLKVPVVKNIVQKVMFARFSRTLSTLIGSGIPLLLSLELVKEILNNKVIEKTIHKSYDNVKNGQPFATPFKDNENIPILVGKMISVGEETGSLEDTLDKLACYYELESKYSLERLTTMIEPMLVIFLMLIIGFIVVSVILPMMQLWQVF